ncbi:MAG: hypothetical protein OXH59_03450, partial [Rhodospirillaceae bacterium]|nr:hypothetical protein [Rhodospirillaceae bacterium]
MAMDHRMFLRSLSRADRKALAEQKDGPGLRHLAVYILLMLAFAIPIALRVPGWPLLMVPLGIQLAFIFNLEHECVHKQIEPALRCHMRPALRHC